MEMGSMTFKWSN